MDDLNTNLSEQLVARLVRLENRVSVVLASFATDIVHLRTEIGKAQNDMMQSLTANREASEAAASRDELNLSALAQSLKTELTNIDGRVATQTNAQDQLQASLSESLGVLQKDLRSLAERAESGLKEQAGLGDTMSVLADAVTGIAKHVQPELIDHLESLKIEINALGSHQTTTSEAFKDQAAIVAAKLTSLELAIAGVAQQVHPELNDHLAALKSEIEGLSTSQTSKYEALETRLVEVASKLGALEARHIETEQRDIAAMTSWGELSMQLQATEQRTLTGLLQVQTDSSNRTSELAVQLNALNTVVESLSDAQLKKLSAGNDKLFKAMETKNVELYRRVEEADSRKRIEDINQAILTVGDQNAQLQAQQEAFQTVLEGKLAQQQVDVIEAVRGLLLEERAYLFNFKLFKK
jgi:uncharacterized protein YqgV (UPF0045/DUF77 family)